MSYDHEKSISPLFKYNLMQLRFLFKELNKVSP
jgi:hypothetical protein